MTLMLHFSTLRNPLLDPFLQLLAFDVVGETLIIRACVRLDVVEFGLEVSIRIAGEYRYCEIGNIRCVVENERGREQSRIDHVRYVVMPAEFSKQHQKIRRALCNSLLVTSRVRRDVDLRMGPNERGHDSVATKDTEPVMTQEKIGKR